MQRFTFIGPILPVPWLRSPSSASKAGGLCARSIAAAADGRVSCSAPSEFGTAEERPICFVVHLFEAHLIIAEYFGADEAGKPPQAQALKTSLCCGLRRRSAEQACAGEPAGYATRAASSSHAASAPGRELFVRDAKWSHSDYETALANLTRHSNRKNVLHCGTRIIARDTVQQIIDLGPRRHTERGGGNTLRVIGNRAALLQNVFAHS